MGKKFFSAMALAAVACLCSCGTAAETFSKVSSGSQESVLSEVKAKYDDNTYDNIYTELTATKKTDSSDSSVSSSKSGIVCYGYFTAILQDGFLECDQIEKTDDAKLEIRLQHDSDDEAYYEYIDAEASTDAISISVMAKEEISNGSYYGISDGALDSDKAKAVMLSCSYIDTVAEETVSYNDSSVLEVSLGSQGSYMIYNDALSIAAYFDENGFMTSGYSEEEKSYRSDYAFSYGSAKYDAVSDTSAYGSFTSDNLLKISEVEKTINNEIDE